MSYPVEILACYDLIPGDIVQNKGSGNAYVVVSNVRGKVVAVRTVEISNTQEWLLVRAAEEHRCDPS